MVAFQDVAPAGTLNVVGSTRWAVKRVVFSTRSEPLGEVALLAIMASADSMVEVNVVDFDDCSIVTANTSTELRTATAEPELSVL